MSSTDERIVKMQFDNAQFKKGAADTKQTLDNVNKSIDATGKNKGLLNLNNGMQQVGVQASKMAIVTTTALATITNKVVNTGLSMVKSLTFDPIKQGFSEYESLLTKQNVIQNATGKSAKVVKRVLNDLNTYSDKTIYSFGNMTESLQKFVNAGIPLKTATTTIKGIANAAAFAGASSEEANRGMYAFAQSMSLGFIQLQDWNQIEQANLGTVKFKNTLLEAGVAAGTLTRKGDGFLTQSGKYVTATKGWRDGLQEQWATTDVLNKALGKYADTNTKLGKKAFEAAQQVRTFSAFMDTLKESIGSGWSSVFTALIGNLGQSTRMWTGLSNAVGGSVNNFFNFLSVAIKTWRSMGGFEKVIEGFSNILSPFKAILTTLGDAWKQAFPNSSSGAGKALYGLSAGFAAITSPLRLLANIIPKLTTPLAFLFRIIGKGVGLIKGFVGGVVDLVQASSDLANIDAPNAGGLMGFLQTLASVAIAAKDALEDVANKGKSIGKSLSKISLPSLSMPDTSGAGEGAAGAASAAKAGASGLSSAASTLLTVAAKIGSIFGSLWDKIKGFLSEISPEDVIKSFNQAIFATMAYEVIRFTHTLRKGFSSLLDIGPTFVDFIEDLGGSLGDFAKAAKREAMAKMIFAVAIALLALSVSLWILSRIPAKQLLQAIGALGALGFILNKSLGAFGEVVEKLDGKGTIGKTLALSVAMVALAGSMILMATAMVIFNYVDWTSIVKGLGTMIVMMGVLQTLGNLGEGAAGKMIAAAAAIAVIAGAMILLAGALLLFKLVDWESMSKAGVTLAALSLAVGLLALIPYQGIAKVGLALLVASVGMIAMANALILFALVKWGSIAKAVVVMIALAASLAIIMAVGGPASAATLLALAGAMIGLALACLIFNKVDWASIGKAAVVLTLLLAALAVGAVILTVFLYAIAPVSPILIVLAAAFFLLGLGLLAFAAAMSLAITLGAAGVAAFSVLATGAAVAIGVFLQTLALQAPIMKESFLKILQELIDGIVESVPMVIRGFKQLWAAIVKEIDGEDKKKSFTDTASDWIDRLTKMLVKLIPKVTSSAAKIIVAFIEELSKHNEALLNAAGDWIVSLIKGAASQRDKVISAAVDVIIQFAQGIADNAIKLVTAGVKMIIEFLHDLADAIRAGSRGIGEGVGDVVSAMASVGSDMIAGMVSGLGSVTDNPAVNRIKDIVNEMIKWAKKIPIINSPSRVFRDIGKFMIQGLTIGVQSQAASAISAVASTVSGQIAVANEYINKFIQSLDQRAIAAAAKADGLRAAADAAAKSAERQAKAASKTKTKTDDHKANKAQKSANALDRKADRADKIANAAVAKAEKAKAAQDRKEEFNNATYLGKAQMRSEDAQRQLDSAKAAEGRAAKDRIQAAALDKQAKAKGVSPAERKKLEKQADDLRAQARVEAKQANKYLNSAKGSARDALRYQNLSGKQAAALYEKQFKAEAKADADAAAYEKLSDADKAKAKRKEAAALDEKSKTDLAKAKKLAMTDLEAANELAQQALDEAEAARQANADADDLEKNGTPSGSVVNLQPTDAAAAAFNQYSDTYDSSYAAAAATPTVEFNQYNSSPEPLNPTEVYRQTNNLLAYAGDKVA